MANKNQKEVKLLLAKGLQIKMNLQKNRENLINLSSELQKIKGEISQLRAYITKDQKALEDLF